jgi:hypothetical protein
MAEKNFSQLPDAGSLTGSEIVPVMQGGVTKRTLASAIAGLVSLTWSAITGKPAVIGAGATQAEARAAIGAGTSDFNGDYGSLTNRPTLGSAAAEDSSAFATAAQGAKADSAVQPTRTVNGHALSADVTVTAADVSAVPTSRTVNGKALSANITLDATDVGARADGWKPGVADIDATGTPSSTTYLRGDGTWSTPAGGGGGLDDAGVAALVADTESDTRQALDGVYATAAQGALADTATQPGDLAAVATSGAYSDLTGTPSIPDSPGDIGAVPTTRTVNGHALSADVTVTKADVGLGSVDNTADAAKAVLSATKLATARTINGVAFDGTANITVADSTKVPTTRTVNGHALSADVTVTAADVGAIPTTADVTAIAIVSALPGSPDAHTLYFVTA